jgi:hypothetical protein
MEINMITAAIIVSGIVFGAVGAVLGFFVGTETHPARQVDAIRVREENQ